MIECFNVYSTPGEESEDNDLIEGEGIKAYSKKVLKTYAIYDM